MKTHIAEIAAAGYFASGLNNPGEVEGVTLAGYHVGISCSSLRAGLLDALERAAEVHAVKVFVDSGAFSEVAFDAAAGKLVTIEPITEADWQERFFIWERLARSIGAGCYVVAPDKVGDQQETLARLAKYRAELHALRSIHGEWDFGPRLIVPVQNGELTASDFAQAACEALGMAEDTLIWGIPLKKGATTVEQLAEFAATCQSDAAFHLLGMGPASPRFEAAVEAILASCPEATITCDAVRITALVGRGSQRASGQMSAPRALTAAQDAIRAAHPGISARELKRLATERVLGRESVELLVGNGWHDPELPAVEAEQRLGAQQLTLLKQGAR